MILRGQHEDRICHQFGRPDLSHDAGDIRQAHGGSPPTRRYPHPTDAHACADTANLAASSGSIRSSGRTSTTTPEPSLNRTK